ncbi:SGNH/GDSL hydrolase family protein [Polaribacter sp. SA4-12]|uniref:SGNH/GDSL hydrolase family protein n=1 Tax=Polaribacter sp. SA4-12 TaxID=1312072 RepID=UPI000B3C362E|nr:SGNH/GDSL hydrolase family protein [Polaribacter sp. SA4-12]ARV16520.1 hypothetical protein BTO07_15855 [Polaribacter sp. SA4-12]
MKRLFLSISIILFISCKTSQIVLKPVIVNYNNKNIAYEGRIGSNNKKKASEIYWSGSSIKINFKGSSAKITLEDQNGNNYFNIFIDGVFSKNLKLEKGLNTYVLAKELSNQNHSIEITKRNEWTFGKTLFYNFEIYGKILNKDPEKSIFIEFYGDSITAGHGNEDYSGDDKPEGNVTNNYNTYAALTARNIDAEYSCIARGGIGIMVSWFNMIMPEMYDRLDPNNPSSKWNFNQKEPDIVVINLLQNDSWIVNYPKHKEFIRRFGKTKPNEGKIKSDYANFIKTIRGKYKNADIVCVLGNMDITNEKSPWPNYVKEAVKSLNDNKIYTCFVPDKNSPGHPKVEDHKVIANKLTKLIQKEILTQ